MADKNATEEITLLEFRNLLGQLKSLATKTIQISGGEPLLHSEVFDMIADCKNANLEGKTASTFCLPPLTRPDSGP